ncbi:hypothetical protein ASPZODRAFT_133484 [Penicilliopsis zonata CBS 506.65]|uniref:Transcription initiation factor TFIID subunit 9 n=1 Tax=Penicilliopsis zonata CBS 506.65 TaxID=1073090 RepID=A0A1L9SEV7_9EURO|nr:hypothetical protein ASPZODRAFT_133484 [Penicilliopsis zonata CBS 506.65]OJJ45627.1 hypothetical protein ASPZODRAFT_133484 [Penicilliopsis zonata CBS 506.65]
MTSPSQTQSSAPATQPLTPPAEQQQQQSGAAAVANNVTSSQLNAGGNTPATANNASSLNATSTLPTAQPPQVPATSLGDSGKSRRPRDVRLIHMLLASLGVTAYQERVPVQLLDFAYRYTSGVLQDAVHLATEGYAGAVGTTDGAGAGGGGRGPVEVNSVSLPALRLSIASRLHYQFQTGVPKEFLMDVAAERNRIALPGASRGFDNGAAAGAAGAGGKAPTPSVMMGGMRLPPERFCLTGTGWNMKDEWDSEGEEEEVPLQQGTTMATAPGGDLAAATTTATMGAAEEADEEAEDDDDGDGRMEDIFGDDTAMGEGDGDGDKTMTDV